MSNLTLSENVNVQCPKCNHEHVIQLFSFIDGVADPQAKEKLFNFDINYFDCENCDLETYLSSILAYADTQNRFCIQYFPLSYLEENNLPKIFHSQFPTMFKEEAIKYNPDYPYIAKPHIVFDFREMVYSIIFYERMLSSK